MTKQEKNPVEPRGFQWMRKRETERARVELKREIMPSVAQLVDNNGLSFERRNRRGWKSDQTGVQPSRTQMFSKDEEKRSRERESN